MKHFCLRLLSFERFSKIRLSLTQDWEYLNARCSHLTKRGCKLISKTILCILLSCIALQIGSALKLCSVHCPALPCTVLNCSALSCSVLYTILPCPTLSCSFFHYHKLSQYFKTDMEPRNRYHGIESTSLCSLAGRYDNPFLLGS